MTEQEILDELQSDPETFKLGDIVKLKCGGPSMIVSHWESDKYHITRCGYICRWFAGKKQDRGTFLPELLELVEEKAEVQH